MQFLYRIFIICLKIFEIPSSFTLQAKQEGGHKFHKIENY